MPDSTRRRPRKKPHADFPLFRHARGYWAKKVRGKLRYFGKIAIDPHGEAALEQWLEQKDDLLAGRTPRRTSDGLTVADLCNHFLDAKSHQVDAGEIKRRTFRDYHATCKIVVKSFGRDRLVDDLAAEDFLTLRATRAKRLGPHALSREVQGVRTLLKYAFDAALIDKPVRFGPTFKRPRKQIMRAHKQKNGPRFFDAEDLRTIIYTADQPLKAMILLGVNCGFGNQDCGTLPRSALDLKKGWVDFPRPKTAVERRSPLWPETIIAIKKAMELRPTPKDRANDHLVFVTRYGQPWAKETADSPVTKEFRKLLDSIDREAAEEARKSRSRPPKAIYRRGIGFYALRHTFETIGGESKDQVAVNHIMGHADNSMAGVYREKISDERLQDVVKHVRAWLFPHKKPR